MCSLPLTDAEIKAVAGPTVYLLHFERPYRHARHYLGFTSNLTERVCRHRAGCGARLIEVISEHGIGFVVARVWRGDRRLERRLKGHHGGTKLCPICQARLHTIGTKRLI